MRADDTKTKNNERTYPLAVGVVGEVGLGGGTTVRAGAECQLTDRSARPTRGHHAPRDPTVRGHCACAAARHALRRPPASVAAGRPARSTQRQISTDKASYARISITKLKTPPI